MSGGRSRSAAHASMPPSSGMSRSSSTTSGARRAAIASASRPSRARPTTSMRSSARSSAAVPSRIRRWSSATSTETGRRFHGTAERIAAVSRWPRGAAARGGPARRSRRPPSAACRARSSAPARSTSSRARARRDARGARPRVAALYLPRRAAGPAPLSSPRGAGARPVARATSCASTPEAWRLAVAGGPPLVFREPASWLVANPFEPPASSGSCCRSAPAASARGRGRGAAAPRALDPVERDGARAARRAARRRHRHRAPAPAAAARRGRARAPAPGRRRTRRPRPGPRAGAARARAARVRARRRGRARAARACARRWAPRTAIVRARLEDLSHAVPIGGLHARSRRPCDGASPSAGCRSSCTRPRRASPPSPRSPPSSCACSARRWPTSSATPARPRHRDPRRRAAARWP